jgi:hypothetical protein
MKFAPAILVTALLVTLAACQPSTEPPQAATPAPISLENARPVTDIERMLVEITELSSDAYGGREPMSEGERLALESASWGCSRCSATATCSRSISSPSQRTPPACG